MALDTLRPADHGEILHGIETASSAWKAGWLLTITSGKLAALVASGASTSAPLLIVGIAVAPATGTTDADAGFHPVYAGRLWEATLDNSAASPYTMLQTDIGKEYGITIDSTTGYAYVNKNVGDATADCCFRIVEGQVGTSQARVRGFFSADTLMFKGS